MARTMIIYKQNSFHQRPRRRTSSNLEVNLRLKFITVRGLPKGTFVLFLMDLLDQSFRNAIYEQPPNKHSQLFEFQAHVLSHFDFLTREARLLEQFGDLDSKDNFLEEAA